ncbi:HlyD family efflux transporter periplasmic adaptor subunit [Corynebacterium timonense]|uniref:HlyD family secretion protein n=1 Tax=Corynebacterium timonense TaxID=441500 RepID=A0A1H1UZ55_9CORY|nr:HlyD family efflux transporter periplasmic adaptor subunit [Corynebacterium timonense]SDS77792.1 HlyD family secretion protein [Corynebacterium timonense]
MKNKFTLIPLAAAAFLSTTLAACAGGGEQIPPADVVELAAKDLTSRVSVSGTVSSRETVALTTTLTSPVTDIPVRVGQPVNEGQIVARIDTSNAQRQLDSQRAQQIASDVTMLNEIERTQQQLAQQQEANNAGLNSRITAADAQLREATARYEKAVADFTARQDQVNVGRDPETVQRANAVDTARRNVNLAGLDTVRADLNTYINALTEQPDTLSPIVGILEADERYAGAQRELKAAQQAYESALHAVDASLGEKQGAVAEAFAAMNDAAIARDATQLAVQHELQAAGTSVDAAQRGLEAQRIAAEVGQAQLRVDIASGDVRSPIKGVVTEVVAQRGQPSSGHLLTVANPDRLTLTANVNEVDSGRVNVGDEVTFTTPSTGLKQYKGRIADVSSVAATPRPAEGAPQTPARPEFPVTIDVFGDTEGLRIGGSAKLQITTDSAQGALTVPREAVIDDNGSYSVLTLREVDGSPGEFEVTEQDVTLGIITDLEAEVRGLAEGTRVLKNPGTYRPMTGQRVQVPEATQEP